MLKHNAVLADGCVLAMDVVTSRAVVEKFAYFPSQRENVLVL